MLWGLERLSGVLTSLLLSLESSFTVLVAVLIVREHLVRLELAGVLSIFSSLARILLAVQKVLF
jgi:drug/metabolite transporter (DMT)-like permease